jgi:hypothetical protein
MVTTYVVVLAALSIVILAVQFSCLFAYQAKKEEAAAVSAPTVCSEAA